MQTKRPCLDHNGASGISNLDVGAYIITFDIFQDVMVQIGKLGEYNFPVGKYAYVGSAMNGLDARVTAIYPMIKKCIGISTIF